MHPDFHLPYLLSYSPFDVESFVIFVVAMLTAILVSAEGQGFAALLLGDTRKEAKDRMHFNVFMHMSLPGTLNFFVAGFGWSRKIGLDESFFRTSGRLRLVASRLAGPLANLLLANIAASINWILTNWNIYDAVFSTIAVVNITMAIYNLIPVPALPGSALLLTLLPAGANVEKFKRSLELVGPYAIVVVFLLIRLSGWQGIANFFNPIVYYLMGIILNI